MKKIKVFCLPYAGGSAMVYKKWMPYSSNFVEIHPVELAGRGNRYNESFYEQFSDAVNDAFNLIKGYLNQSPYALFGHSMGSTMVYELYYKIMEHHLTGPIHIFFSGSKPPYTRVSNCLIHKLPDHEFIEEILKLGGTPREVFENEELFDIFIPILRADYKILENYKYYEKDKKINCPITVLNSESDISMDEMGNWKYHTDLHCNFYHFDGGHFFINENFKQIARMIDNTLVKKAGNHLANSRVV